MSEVREGGSKGGLMWEKRGGKEKYRAEREKGKELWGREEKHMGKLQQKPGIWRKPRKEGRESGCNA